MILVYFSLVLFLKFSFTYFPHNYHSSTAVFDAQIGTRNKQTNSPKLSIWEQYVPFAVGNSERNVPV